MKLKSTVIVSFLFLFSLNSCIQKEPLNAEADILECYVDGTLLKSDPVVTNTSVLLLAKPDIMDRTALAPEFTITEGAVIEPASGTVRDFTYPQTYTVTSQDGKWQKVYTVSVMESEISTKYDFEDWELTTIVAKTGEIKEYQTPVEVTTFNLGPVTIHETQGIWTSGNGGFALVAGKEASPDLFPTGATTDRVSGKYAAKLETKATGYDIMPLAAGNLFLGKFNPAMAMIDVLRATEFGQPFGRLPETFKGYYKYTAGEVYRDKAGNTLDQKDRPYIYSLLYEKGPNDKMLNGNDILDNDRTIAIAMLENPIETSEYTYFEIDYKYLKEVDPVKLANYEYYLAVVFSASYLGDLFMGAVGSTLHIDEVEIVCREDNAE